MFNSTQSDFLVCATTVTLYLRAHFGYDNRFLQHHHHHQHYFTANLRCLAAGKTWAEERL
jgi:hypothetical protein